MNVLSADSFRTERAVGGSCYSCLELFKYSLVGTSMLKDCYNRQQRIDIMKMVFRLQMLTTFFLLYLFEDAEKTQVIQALLPGVQRGDRKRIRTTRLADKTRIPGVDRILACRGWLNRVSSTQACSSSVKK